MRLLLPAVLWLASACVTERGVRRPVELKPLSSRCEAGPPSAALDPAVRDRVRLVFSATERCDEQAEQVYQVEHRRQLPVWLRVVFSVPAAATVGGAIAIGLATLHSQAGVHLSGAGDAVAWAILGPALITGGATFGALSASEFTTTVETEPASRKTIRAVVSESPVKGAASWAGAPGPPRELFEGALELTLAEAEGLESGALTLDGVPVTLSTEARDRLGFLAACADAVRGFEPSTAAQEPMKARLTRLKRAEGCEWNGWGFAQEVVSVLSGRAVSP